MCSLKSPAWGYYHTEIAQTLNIYHVCLVRSGVIVVSFQVSVFSTFHTLELLTVEHHIVLPGPLVQLLQVSPEQFLVGLKAHIF